MSAIPQPVQDVLSAQQQALNSKIAFAVAGKQQDAVNLQGQAAVDMIDQAAQLSKAIGAGKHFDGLA